MGDAHVSRGTPGRGICVETMQSCAFRDGSKEFATYGCGDQFEPDGIYDASPAALNKELDAMTATAIKDTYKGKCVANTPFYFDDKGVEKADANVLCVAKTSKAACDGFALPGGEKLCTFVDVTNKNDHVAGGLMWGRRLTSFERACHVGKFDPTKVAFAGACAIDSDCTRCGGWTQVVSGVCKSGKCASLSDAAADLTKTDKVGNGYYADASGKSAPFPYVSATAAPKTVTDKFNAVCRTALFGVKFSAAGTPGVQNLLEVTTGDADTAMPGASPLYVSSGLTSMGVVHAGIPDFVQGRENTEAQYAKGSSRPKDYTLYLKEKTSIQMWDRDTCAAAQTTANSGAKDVQCLDFDHINFLAKAQSFNLQSYEGDQEDVPKIVVTNKAVYTTEEINTRTSANYDEVLQCSNQGACGYDTGLCTCASGFTGDSCGTQVSFV